MATKKSTSSKTNKQTSTKSTKTEENQIKNMDSMKNGMNKKLLLIVLVGFIAGLLYYFRGSFIAATVNGTPITRLEVIQELERQGGQQALEGLVSQKLIEQEAQNQGISITQEEIDQELQSIEDELSAQGQTLDQLLEFQGIDRSQVEDQARIQLTLEKLLGDKIEVTEEEIEEAYESQLDAIPEDADPEEIKNSIKESLKNQKLATQVQAYLGELQEKASINYLLQY